MWKVPGGLVVSQVVLGLAVAEALRDVRDRDGARAGILDAGAARTGPGELHGLTRISFHIILHAVK